LFDASKSTAMSNATVAIEIISRKSSRYSTTIVSTGAIPACARIR
jgi:hypothetical protein